MRAQMGRKATLLPSHDMSQFDVLKLVGVSDNHDALAAAEKEMAALPHSIGLGDPLQSVLPRCDGCTRQ